TILDGLFALAVLLPTIAVMVRRLHDINMSGWWGWLFIPFGLPILIVGFIDSKEEQKQDEKVNNTSPVSVMSAVVNHSKDAMSQIKPAVSGYVEKHQTANQQTSETQSTLNTFAAEDDKMYEVAMKEIETDTTQKGAWAKAFSQSEGDKDKTEALYIKFRVQSMVAEENVKVQKEAKDRLDSEIEPIEEIKTENNIKHKTIEWLYIIPIVLVALIIMAVVFPKMTEQAVVFPKKTELNESINKETFYDTLTGLTWQDNAAAASITKPWLTEENYKGCVSNQASSSCYDTSGDTAATYCSELSLGGYTDWRLPSRTELEGIYSSRSNLNNVSSDYYWSSTTDEYYKGNAWIVFFYDGGVGYFYKYANGSVRCVRAGQ
ncbi:MAG: DUF1566 domain-containing protein, partial [Sulfurimonas sp.]|nr:DUF1566 domain-containing protein [Sulfurimonas sp.]